VVTRGSERPVLLMFGAPEIDGTKTEVDAGRLEVSQLADVYYWTLLRRSTADWYRVTLARTHHGHFSDAALMEVSEPEFLHPRAAHAIVNGYVLEFFDKYVRGDRKNTPLLSGARKYPEATLLRKRTQTNSPPPSR